MRKELPFALMLFFAFTRIGLEALYGMNAFKLATGEKLLDAFGYSLAYMGYAALFLGALNLSRVHVNNLRRKRANWGYSAWLLAVLVAFTGYGLLRGPKDTWYNWVYTGVYKNIDATMFSLIAFYIASAAYRAFRVRSVEAGLMMVVAVVVMLAQVPIGEFIWGRTGPLGGFPGITDWILAVPNAASGRAISLGIFLGIMATQTRVLLGIERRHLGHD